MGAATVGIVVAGAVGAGSAVVSGNDVDFEQAGAAASQSIDLNALAERADRASRSADRTAPRVTMKPQAQRHAWSTAPLNVWKGPREQGPRTDVVPFATKLALTGQREGHWAEIVVKNQQARWVNADYLAKSKPKPKPRPEPAAGGATTSGISTAACPDGSGTESGLVPDAVRLYRAVCAAFPALTTYGGYDPHGEHVNGHAIDFMVSDPDLGQAIAEWVRAHAAELNIYDVIWAQRIWTPERAAEGWRWMPDRGSATANHYDHVHVAVN